MTDESDALPEFVFRTPDQAGEASQAHSSYGHYDAELDTYAPGVSGDSNQTNVSGLSSRFPGSGVQSQQISPGFAGLGFAPTTPVGGWDWTRSIDFSSFTQYEPQGELAHESLNQSVSNNDFSIPLPIAFPQSAYQSFLQAQSANPISPAAQTQILLSPPPPPGLAQQRPVLQTGMKRKLDSEPSSAVSQSAGATSDNPSKRQNKSRESSDASTTSPAVADASEAHFPALTPNATASSVDESAPRPAAQDDSSSEQRKDPSKGTGPQGRVIDVSKPRRVAESPHGLDILPAGKVFPIQIGSELFRLSGASLSSDAPSYFSHFFGQQLHDNGGRAGDVSTLYIDRDPDTFREIALHLQGYHITPRDGEHFVKLFADAQFYSLPRLTKQLFKTDIFVRIGGTPFQIPRDLFAAPGDSPNYFSLGFAQFFSTPSEVFPGLDRNALLRPPSISPPSVPNRNGETFGELIQLLQGYDVEIKSNEHRSRLLRDARYFHLKGLEQRLLPCQISYNLKRQQHEILLRLEDIRGQSLAVSPGPASTSKAASPAPSTTSTISSNTRSGYVSYARPYTDDHAQVKYLVLEISSAETTTLYLPSTPPQTPSQHLSLRATFHNATLARITSLFSVIASKMGLPATQPLGLMYLQSGGGVAAQPVSPANSGVSERCVRVRVDTDTALEMNGRPAELCVDKRSGRVGVRYTGRDEWAWGGANMDAVEADADDEDGDRDEEIDWVIKRAHWRLRVEPVDTDRGDPTKVQVVLCGVKIEAFSTERSRNADRPFLAS
ncbi:hypothetical protein ACN47E_006108 [Coniothyrium glycines]